MLKPAEPGPPPPPVGSRIIEGITVLLAALLVLLGVSTFRDVRLRPPTAAPQGTKQADASARLDLRIVDNKGKAVEKCQVVLYRFAKESAQLLRRVDCGPAGQTTLSNLPKGPVWVFAKSGTLARRSTRLILRSGEQKLRLRLAPGNLFEVVVVDPNQRPLGQARISLFGSDPLVRGSVTDRRGLAQFTNLGASPYALEVRALGYDSKRIENLDAVDSPLFVKLDRLGKLRVSVLTADSKPAAGATVFLAGPTLWPARKATTNAAGYVNINKLSRGFYDVRAERNSEVSDTRVGFAMHHGQTQELRLKLKPGVYVNLKVTDGNGAKAKGVAKADIALVEGGLSSFPVYGQTNAKGEAKLGPIASRAATLSVRAAGFVPSNAIDIGDDEKQLVVPLMRGGTLSGQIRDRRGFPVGGVRLEVVGVDRRGMPIAESGYLNNFRNDHFAFALPGARPLIPAGELGIMPVVPDIPMAGQSLTVSTSRSNSRPWTSQRDGVFRLNPITPGRVRILAQHPNYVSQITSVVELAPGQNQQVDITLLSGGMLEGRVLEQDGPPVAGARLELSSVDGAVERVSYTADDGTFAFAAVPDQVIVSVARPSDPEHIVARMQVEVEADETRQLEIVVPKPRASVSFRVVNDEGFPIERAQLVVSSLVPDVALTKTLFSSDGGQAELADAAGLPLRVVLTRDGFAPSVAELERCPQRLDLSMSAATKTKGIVASQTTQVANAKVVLLTPTGARYTSSNSTGAFSLKNLATGSARLLIHAKGFVPMERMVELNPNSENDLGRIEISAGASLGGTVVDGMGKPIRGARVSPGRVPTYLPMGDLPIGVVTTDRKGRFLLSGLSEKIKYIESFKVGYLRNGVSNVNIQAGRRTDEVRIELEEDVNPAPFAFRASGSLAVTLGESAEGIVFEHVPLGGEAQRAGILAGDVLRRVDGNRVRGLERARRLLTGALSQELVLELSRGPNLRWRLRLRRERLRR